MALSRAAPMPASCISWVRARKVRTVCSSVPRVLVVLGPGDALVEGPGDAGVQLGALSGSTGDAVLEIPGEHRHHRHDDDDHQRQPPIQDQHGGKGPQHIEQRPQDIRQIPGHHAGNAVGIAHDPVSRYPTGVTL